MDPRLAAWYRANLARAADARAQQADANDGAVDRVNQVEGQFYDPATRSDLNYLKADPVYPTTADMAALGSPRPGQPQQGSLQAILASLFPGLAQQPQAAQPARRAPQLFGFRR